MISAWYYMIVLQWIESRLHNPQKVVYMDPHLKDILGFVPSTLKPLYLVWPFAHLLDGLVIVLRVHAVCGTQLLGHLELLRVPGHS